MWQPLPSIKQLSLALNDVVDWTDWFYFIMSLEIEKLGTCEIGRSKCLGFFEWDVKAPTWTAKAGRSRRKCWFRSPRDREWKQSYRQQALRLTKTHRYCDFYKQALQKGVLPLRASLSDRRTSLLFPPRPRTIAHNDSAQFHNLTIVHDLTIIHGVHNKSSSTP